MNMELTKEQIDQMRDNSLKACAILEAISKCQLTEEDGIDCLSLIDAALSFCKENDSMLENAQYQSFIAFNTKAAKGTG